MFDKYIRSWQILAFLPNHRSELTRTVRIFRGKAIKNETQKWIFGGLGPRPPLF